MSKDSKLPYMKFYPADLDSEPTLKLCSWEAGFLWIKLLGLMHHAPQRGFLIKQNGDAYTEKDLLMIISGATQEKLRTCLLELEINGVFSRDRRKIIYCRKMVKGEKRIKNLGEKNTKQKDKSEINRRKNGDKSDLALAVNNCNLKEILSSGDRSVVKPESRVQSLESKDKKNNIKKIPKPESVSEQTWSDFLQHRKTKKSNLTQTALNGIINQARLARIPLEDALTEMITRGWVGFKADWMHNQNQQSKGNYQNGKPTKSELIDRELQDFLDGQRG